MAGLTLSQIRELMVKQKTKERVKTHGLILLAALLATLIITNFTEHTTESMLRSNYFKITYDADGIPFVDYGVTTDGIYIGKQRNPVTVSQVALRYYENYQKGNESQKQLFLNCANWLVNNSKTYGNYSVLEYTFPWPRRYNMTPPWRSALAQAQALQVLIRAHNLTKDEKYLSTARKLLNAFFYEVKEGGVTYKSQDSGWWYEEYADEGGKVSMVLNGMMITLIGLYEYYEYTKDPDAKFLFDQGVLALEKNLPRYNMNGYSYYDILGKPASEKYHQIHIALLEQLYNLTSKEIFKEYHDKWRAYKKPPFVVRLFQPPLTNLEIAIFVINFVVVLITLEILVFIIVIVKNKTAG